MLRNVLEDYLSSVKEREFYYPLTALLHAKLGAACLLGCQGEAIAGNGGIGGNGATNYIVDIANGGAVANDDGSILTVDGCAFNPRKVISIRRFGETRFEANLKKRLSPTCRIRSSALICHEKPSW